MKFKLLFLFLLFNPSLQAQEKNLKSNYISLGISPLSLIEPKTSTFETVLEIKPVYNFAIEIKYGFPLGYTQKNISRLNDTYYETKIGLKHWLFSDFRYIGLEYFRVNHQYRKENSYFVDASDAIIYESANILRKVNGVRFRFGYDYSFKSGLTLEAFSGLGIRNVDISYNSIVNASSPVPFVPVSDEGWFGSKEREIGSKNKFDYYFGVKVSWKLFNW